MGPWSNRRCGSGEIQCQQGLATDKNGDGVFTPGYDVNVRINDAWGVRDIIRTGMLFSGGFEGWMAKVRRPALGTILVFRKWK